MDVCGDQLMLPSGKQSRLAVSVPMLQESDLRKKTLDTSPWQSDCRWSTARPKCTLGNYISLNSKLNSGWWFQPIWKILVNMGIFPNFWGENKKYLKPPPRNLLDYFGKLSGCSCVVFWVPILHWTAPSWSNVVSRPNIFCGRTSKEVHNKNKSSSSVQQWSTKRGSQTWPKVTLHWAFLSEILPTKPGHLQKRDNQKKHYGSVLKILKGASQSHACKFEEFGGFT